MDSDPASSATPAMDLSGSTATTPSLNGYGSSAHGETDPLMLIGAAFVGGLLLGALVGRIGS
jgi:hypothetical protein